MHTEGDEIHVDETEASGGSKEGVVRWILIVGTLLAIILLSAIWIFGAATQGDVEEEATVSGAIDSRDEGYGTDSIIGIDGDADEGPMGTVEGAEPGDSDTPLETIDN